MKILIMAQLPSKEKKIHINMFLPLLTIDITTSANEAYATILIMSLWLATGPWNGASQFLTAGNFFASYGVLNILTVYMIHET